MRYLLPLLFVPLIAAADDARPAVRIEPVESWSGVFGDSETTFRFRVVSDVELSGRLSWSFSSNGRTIQRGQSPVEAGADRPAIVAAKLRIPPIKEGVVFPAQIAVEVVADGAKEPLAAAIKPIWMFHADPFSDRTKWLESLSITLFDPVGKTAETFEKAMIPFQAVRNFGALERVKSGVVIIGEGVSWHDHRRLPETLLAAAARGVNVLCLAPSEGQSPWPVDEPEAPRAVSFTRSQIITQLDERLDAAGWPPDGKLVASRFELKPQRDRVVLEVTDSAAAWPWMEIRFASEGRLLLCGFGLIKSWNDGPTPRYLLSRLLEDFEKSVSRP